MRLVVRLVMRRRELAIAWWSGRRKHGGRAGHLFYARRGSGPRAGRRAEGGRAAVDLVRLRRWAVPRSGLGRVIGRVSTPAGHVVVRSALVGS